MHWKGEGEKEKEEGEKNDGQTRPPGPTFPFLFSFPSHPMFPSPQVHYGVAAPTLLTNDERRMFHFFRDPDTGELPSIPSPVDVPIDLLEEGHFCDLASIGIDFMGTNSHLIRHYNLFLESIAAIFSNTLRFHDTDYTVSEHTPLFGWLQEDLAYLLHLHQHVPAPPPIDETVMLPPSGAQAYVVSSELTLPPPRGLADKVKERIRDHRSYESCRAMATERMKNEQNDKIPLLEFRMFFGMVVKKVRLDTVKLGDSPYMSKPNYRTMRIVFQRAMTRLVFVRMPGRQRAVHLPQYDARVDLADTEEIHFGEINIMTGSAVDVMRAAMRSPPFLTDTRNHEATRTHPIMDPEDFVKSGGKVPFTVFDKDVGTRRSRCWDAPPPVYNPFIPADQQPFSPVFVQQAFTKPSLVFSEAGEGDVVVEEEHQPTIPTFQAQIPIPPEAVGLDRDDYGGWFPDNRQNYMGHTHTQNAFRFQVTEPVLPNYRKHSEYQGLDISYPRTHTSDVKQLVYQTFTDLPTTMATPVTEAGRTLPRFLRAFQQRLQVEVLQLAAKMRKHEAGACPPPPAHVFEEVERLKKADLTLGLDALLPFIELATRTSREQEQQHADELFRREEEQLEEEDNAFNRHHIPAEARAVGEEQGKEGDPSSGQQGPGGDDQEEADEDEDEDEDDEDDEDEDAFQREDEAGEQQPAGETVVTKTATSKKRKGGATRPTTPEGAVDAVAQRAAPLMADGSRPGIKRVKFGEEEEEEPPGVTVEDGNDVGDRFLSASALGTASASRPKSLLEGRDRGSSTLLMRPRKNYSVFSETENYRMLPGKGEGIPSVIKGLELHDFPQNLKEFVVKTQSMAMKMPRKEKVMMFCLSFLNCQFTILPAILLAALGGDHHHRLTRLVQEVPEEARGRVLLHFAHAFKYDMGLRTQAEARRYLGRIMMNEDVTDEKLLEQAGLMLLLNRFYAHVSYEGPDVVTELTGTAEERMAYKYQWMLQQKMDMFLRRMMYCILVKEKIRPLHRSRCARYMRYNTPGMVMDFNLRFVVGELYDMIKAAMKNIQNLYHFMEGNFSFVVGAKKNVTEYKHTKAVAEALAQSTQAPDFAALSAESAVSSSILMSTAGSVGAKLSSSSSSSSGTATALGQTQNNAAAASGNLNATSYVQLAPDGYIGPYVTAHLKNLATEGDMKEGKFHAASPLRRLYVGTNAINTNKPQLQVVPLSPNHVKAQDRRSNLAEVGMFDQYCTALTKGGAWPRSLTLGTTITEEEQEDDVRVIKACLRAMEREDPTLFSRMTVQDAAQEWESLGPGVNPLTNLPYHGGLMVAHNETNIGVTRQPERLMMLLRSIAGLPWSSPGLKMMEVMWSTDLNCLNIDLSGGALARILMNIDPVRRTIKCPPALVQLWMQGKLARLNKCQPHSQTQTMVFSAEGYPCQVHRGGGGGSRHVDVSYHTLARDLLYYGTFEIFRLGVLQNQMVGVSIHRPHMPSVMELHMSMTLSAPSTFMQWIPHAPPARLKAGTKKYNYVHSGVPRLFAPFGRFFPMTKEVFYSMAPESCIRSILAARVFKAVPAGGLSISFFMSAYPNLDDAILAGDSDVNPIVCRYPRMPDKQFHLGLSSAVDRFQEVKTRQSQWYALSQHKSVVEAAAATLATTHAEATPILSEAQRLLEQRRQSAKKAVETRKRNAAAAAAAAGSEDTASKNRQKKGPRISLYQSGDIPSGVVVTSNGGLQPEEEEESSFPSYGAGCGSGGPTSSLPFSRPLASSSGQPETKADAFRRKRAATLYEATLQERLRLDLYGVYVFPHPRDGLTPCFFTHTFLGKFDQEMELQRRNAKRKRDGLPAIAVTRGVMAQSFRNEVFKVMQSCVYLNPLFSMAGPGQKLARGCSLFLALRMFPCDMDLPLVRDLPALRGYDVKSVERVQQIYQHKIQHEDYTRLVCNEDDHGSIIEEVFLLPTHDVRKTYLIVFVLSRPGKGKEDKNSNGFMDKGVRSEVGPRCASIVSLQGHIPDQITNPHGVIRRGNLAGRMKEFKYQLYAIENPHRHFRMTGTSNWAMANFSHATYTPDTGANALHWMKTSYVPYLLSPQEAEASLVPYSTEEEYIPGSKRPQDFELDDALHNPAAGGWVVYESCLDAFGGPQAVIPIGFMRHLGRQAREVHTFMDRYFQLPVIDEATRGDLLRPGAIRPFHLTFHGHPGEDEISQSPFFLDDHREHHRRWAFQWNAWSSVQKKRHIMGSMPWSLRQHCERRLWTFPRARLWLETQMAMLGRLFGQLGHQPEWHAIVSRAGLPWEVTTLTPIVEQVFQRKLGTLFMHYRRQIQQTWQPTAQLGDASSSVSSPVVVDRWWKYYFDVESGGMLERIFQLPSADATIGFWCQWLTVDPSPHPWLQYRLFPLIKNALEHELGPSARLYFTASQWAVFQLHVLEPLCRLWRKQLLEVELPALRVAFRAPVPREWGMESERARYGQHLQWEAWMKEYQHVCHVLHPCALQERPNNVYRAGQLWTADVLRWRLQAEQALRAYTPSPTLFNSAVHRIQETHELKGGGGVWYNSWLQLCLVDMGDAEMAPFLLHRLPHARLGHGQIVVRTGDGALMNSPIYMGLQIMCHIDRESAQIAKVYNPNNVDPNTLEPMDALHWNYMEIDALRGIGASLVYTNTYLKNSNICVMRVCRVCKSIVGYRCVMDETRELVVRTHANRLQVRKQPYCPNCRSADMSQFCLIYAPNMAALGHLLSPVNIDMNLFLNSASLHPETVLPPMESHARGHDLLSDCQIRHAPIR